MPKLSKRARANELHTYLAFHLLLYGIISYKYITLTDLTCELNMYTLKL